MLLAVGRTDDEASEMTVRREIEAATTTRSRLDPATRRWTAGSERAGGFDGNGAGGCCLAFSVAA
jgi:hypothetical protein